MSKELINTKWFNVVITALIAATFILFNYEFRTALLMGFVLAVLSYPLSNFLSAKLNTYLKSYAKPVSSVLTILFITLITFFIFNLLGAQIVKEVPKLASGAYDTINQLPTNQSFLDAAKPYGITQEFIESRVKEFNNLVEPAKGGHGVNFEYYLNQDNLNKALNLGQQALNVIFNQIVYLILFFLAWYNGLVFGAKWLDSIFTILPFRSDEKQVVLKDLEIGVRNVIYANILSGLINAFACFLIMLVFGVDNIFIITIIVFLIGFLPASPSELGYAIPITIIFTKNPAAAIVVAILAELLILWVNYLFLPKIILSGNEGNPLFVITSVLVGLEIFGLMGFIIGPVIMIFINTLTQILLKRIKNEDLAIENKSGWK